jgi:hypothetical protein
VSYRIFSVGQATKTLSSPQFSGASAGRGRISILGKSTGATRIFDIADPFSIAGSLTGATLATEPDPVPLAVRPLSIAGRARAGAAGALGCGPALLGTPAPGILKDAPEPWGATLALALEGAPALRTGEGVGLKRSCGG